MRITIVSEHYAIRGEAGPVCHGGVEASAFRIARELAPRHDVHVISSRKPGSPQEDEFDGHRVSSVGPEIPYTQFGQKLPRLRFLAAVKKAVGRERTDVVLNFSLLTSYAAFAGACRTGTPAVAWVTDVWQGRWAELVGFPAALVAGPLERWWLSLAWSRYVAISEPTRERLLAIGVPTRRIRVIPPPVDVEAARSALPIEAHGRPIVCYVGRLVEYKGLGTLLAAIASLAEEFAHLRLLVVGAGPDAERFRTIATELGVGDRVDWLGAGPNLEFAFRAIRAADIFCLPSLIEGFGLVVPEAMAAGKPVVCSDIPALRWVAGEGRFASLVPPGKVDDFAGAIRGIAADPGAAARRAVRAQEWADRFSPKSVSLQMVRLLEEMLEEARKGR